MAKRWRLHPHDVHADPGGETFLQPLGLFDAAVYLSQGRDFAERTELSKAHLEAWEIRKSNALR